MRRPASNSSPTSYLPPSTLLWCLWLSSLDVYTVVLRCMQPESRASLIWRCYRVFLEKMLVIYFLSFPTQLSRNTDWNFVRFVSDFTELRILETLFCLVLKMLP